MLGRDYILVSTSHQFFVADKHGYWLNLAERSVWDREVSGSTPECPTNFQTSTARDRETVLTCSWPHSPSANTGGATETGLLRFGPNFSSPSQIIQNTARGGLGRTSPDGEENTFLTRNADSAKPRIGPGLQPKPTISFLIVRIRRKWKIGETETYLGRAATFKPCSCRSRRRPGSLSGGAYSAARPIYDHWNLHFLRSPRPRSRLCTLSCSQG